jgi:DNA-binding CsgD family transcriptional regulator/PAS domain-containing protein
MWQPSANMKLTHAELSDLIGQIYDCSLNPEGWAATLSKICSYFDAAYAAISLADPRLGDSSGRMAVFSPWDAMRLRELNEDYGVMGVPGLRDVIMGDVDQPQSTLAQMSESDFQQSDFYRNWVAPQNLREACVTKIVHTRDRIGIMAIITRKSRRPISADDRAFVALLSPHLRRACLIGDLLDHQRVAASNYRLTIEKLSIPIILTDVEQTIVYANARAHDLLRMEKFIASRSGKLHVVQTAASRALSDALSRASQVGAAMGQRGIGIPMTPAGAPPAVAYVLPLTGTAERGVFGAATAAIFLSLTESWVPPPEAALTALYDLTPAEARIMCFMGSGLDTASVANTLHISINTVKSHQKQIFQKTNTRRQAEVALLVAELAPQQTL